MMNKENLLKVIADSGYNIGFGAKKNFATFDIVEKAPGWLGFLSLIVGIYALFVPELATNHISAAMVVFGITTLYISFYLPDKDRYEKAGIELTGGFHRLRALYYEVKSLPDGTDFTKHVAEHDAIVRASLNSTVSKQIFLSDWYAHFKFFWQQQTDWLDEQKHFKLLRDKLPLSFSLTVLLALAGAGGCSYCNGLPTPCALLQ
ncbi:MAG: SLATT domain-containing protein [Thauera aminoaromatica]|nr:SLATT domain-containing protein [Thauera aminoaromatica]